MRVTYGQGFAPAVTGRQRVERLQEEVSKLPQYEPETTHTFHGGMYCREVRQCADSLVVGKVHKKDHMLVVLSGTMLITDGVSDAIEITGPKLICSKPGTKRSLYAVTDAAYMTVHVTDATTVEDAENELVEADPASMFTIGNKIKVKELTWHS